MADAAIDAALAGGATLPGAWPEAAEDMDMEMTEPITTGFKLDYEDFLSDDGADPNSAEVQDEDVQMKDHPTPEPEALSPDRLASKPRGLANNQLPLDFDFCTDYWEPPLRDRDGPNTIRFTVRAPPGYKPDPRPVEYTPRPMPARSLDVYTFGEDDKVRDAKAQVWCKRRAARVQTLARIAKLEGGDASPVLRSRDPRYPTPFSKPPEQITREDFAHLTDDFDRISEYLTADDKAISRKDKEEKANARGRARELAESKKGRKIVKPVSKEWQDTIDSKLAIRDVSATISNENSLTRRDLAMLLPAQGAPQHHGWLNDEVVNTYLARILDEQHKEDGYQKKKGKIPRVHAFNSQFMVTIAEKGYEGVRRWAKRMEIEGDKLMSTEQILFPCCDNLHWTLVAVQPQTKTIRYLDSLHGQGLEWIRNVKLWLKGELGDNYVEGEWKVQNGVQSNRQRNGKDCGVFTAMNGHALLTKREPIISFPSADAPDARSFMASVLMGAEFDRGWA